MNKFPKNFIWGTSTASHQIEGNTTNDWSVWEKANADRLTQDIPKMFKKLSPVWDEVKAEAINRDNYISGAASDSYARFSEDINLIEQLGIKAYRFSIEWARINPQEGIFDQTAIDHYREMIILMKSKGIEPFLTTLHRTIPVWIATQGGWGNKKTVVDYNKYVAKLVEAYGDQVKYWIPLNEPILNVGGGFVTGQIPQGRKNIFLAFRAYTNMIIAHNYAYQIIHSNRSTAMVGPAHAAVYVEPFEDRWINKILVSILHYFANWKFFNGTKAHTDFIGIQYYTRGVIALKFKWGVIPTIQNIFMPGPASDMGQEIYPEGIYKFMEMIWKRYRKPIIVTENGIADRNDRYRAKYITDHIAQVEKAIANGIDVRGYFYWSLLDNFEWDKGFWPQFGLIKVDRITKNRTIRVSAKTYTEIIINNSI